MVVAHNGIHVLCENLSSPLGVLLLLLPPSLLVFLLLSVLLVPLYRVFGPQTQAVVTNEEADGEEGGGF